MVTGHLADQRLDASPASVRAARRAVREVIRRDLDDTSLECVLLATSEVVTNAIEHGDEPIVLRVDRMGHRLRVEVQDASPLPPRSRDQPPGPAEVRGRGMLIVERCSDRWGVDDRTDGKAVWFEVDL